ncbi:putative glycerophosphodiester phosphodiesterase [Helianthus anomalus]
MKDGTPIIFHDNFIISEENGNVVERPVLFSSFQPDVALLMKKLQHQYPVFFLTNGGNETYDDVRMNSLEEAKNLAISGGLDGVVLEVKGIFRKPSVYLMGVEGVIVDLVEEITSAIAGLKTGLEGGLQGKQKTYKIELSFLLNLISHVIQH